MKVMHVGQQIRARHGLTSSHPSGWVISRGSRGVVTKVEDSEPLLYTARFQVFDGGVKVVTVAGISSRDILPLASPEQLSEQLSQAS